MPHTPWYRDGLVWTFLCAITAGILIGLLMGQYINL